MRLLTLISLLFAVPASFAEYQQSTSAPFAQCSGYHHGSYLDFYKDFDGTVYVKLSNDGDSPVWPLYQVTQLKFEWEDALDEATTSIQSAINAMNSSDGSVANSYTFVEADGPANSKMFLNLNNHYGDSFVVVDGSVEPIECLLPR